jgi:solute carrier family 25 (mitochondrial S-adenosylmethionine transporter), member 26
MTAAGCAGGIAAASTTPLDVIKTQQQITAQSRTLWQTALDIHARRGLHGFFAGVMPRSVRAVPAGAIVVSTYELLKARLLSSHV